MATPRRTRHGILRRISLWAAPAAVAVAAGSVAHYSFASAQAPSNPPPPRYYGVNLPSGSFGGKRLPGVYGKDYVYPTAKTAVPFRAMGMNTVRLAFRWERLQREPMGPLDREELARIDAAVRDLGSFNTIVLNVHNYARYGGMALDQPGQSGAMLADLWFKLAQHFKSNRRIAFGIMNEPHGIDNRQWRAIAEQTVAAIRATGAKNLVLVPGTRWTGGHSWHAGGANSNAAVMSGFRDPGRNFVFEIHQYLDADSSGTKKECDGPETGRKRLARVTQWLRENKAKAILGEFGVPPTPNCLAALDDLMGFLRSNGDVWVGWTYWAGGDWWGKYPYSIQPDENGPKPQSVVLGRHIGRY